MIRALLLYALSAMCFISYLWIRNSRVKLTKGVIYDLFTYILWIVRWGFLCMLWLFLVELKLIAIDEGLYILSFAFFLTIQFMITSYAAAQMRRIGDTFGFR